jgi:ubiquinone/menaquinone biosynthesis C-methylase UbiE
MTNPSVPPSPPGPLASREAWDLVAEGYAAEARDVMLPFTKHAIALANPPPGARVLDVAAGSGMLSLEIAGRVQRVDALDFSDLMLAQLNQRRESAGIENVFTRPGDGQNLPYEDSTFDAAFSMFGLMFFPDRLRGFCELFRVCKAGASVVVSSWAPVDQSPLMMLMFGALRAADPDRAAPKPNLLNLENPELFRQEMEQAGFRDVEVKAFTNEVAIQEPDRYWDVTVRASAPLALLKQRLGAEEWVRQERLAKDYIATILKGPCSLGTTAYLGFGRK